MDFGDSLIVKRGALQSCQGAILGLVSGVVITFETWLFAAIIKWILTLDTGIWPEGFPGHIPDFILSRWWAVIVIVTLTVAGAIDRALRPRHFELW